MIPFSRSKRPSRPMPDTGHRFLQAVASRILKDPNYSVSDIYRMQNADCTLREYIVLPLPLLKANRKQTNRSANRSNKFG